MDLWILSVGRILDTFVVFDIEQASAGLIQLCALHIEFVCLDNIHLAYPSICLSYLQKNMK